MPAARHQLCARVPPRCYAVSVPPRCGGRVSRLLLVAAVAVVALGLLWVVWLQRAETKSPGATSHVTSADPATEGAITIAAGGTAPAVTLGPIGGALPRTLVDPKLLIEKSHRTLAVFSAGQVVKTYRISLG